MSTSAESLNLQPNLTMSTEYQRFRVNDDDSPFDVIKQIRCSRGMDVEGNFINPACFETFKMLGSSLKV
jgi:hypothetical protein